VANTLKLHRNGGVGFIDWLGVGVMSFHSELAISFLFGVGR